MTGPTRRPERPLPVVSIDETGSTGEHLLDPAQPTFAVAAIHLDPDVARDVVEPFLRDGRRELHFVNLRQTPTGRADVVALLGDRRLGTGSARVSVLHKPTAMTAKTLDLLLEPAIAATGHDFYADGANVHVTQLALTRGPQACGADEWEWLMQTSMRLLWRGKPEDVEEYRRALARCRYRCDDQHVAQLLAMLPYQRGSLEVYGAGGVASGLLEPMISAVYEQALHWSRRLGWHLIQHDASDVLAVWRDRILELSNPKNVAKYQVTATSKLKRLYLADMVPVSSHDAPAVQIADVLAGACRAWLNARAGMTEHRDLLEGIEGSGALSLIEHWLWPGDPPSIV